MTSDSSFSGLLVLPSFLGFYSTTESGLRIALIGAVIFLVIHYSTLFEQEYNEKLMNLYTYPWWRFLLVFLVIASATWSPELAVFVALAVFFYLNDMNTLIEPIARG